MSRPEPRTTPLRGFGGSARRERPVFERGPAGPWRVRCRVVPITGIQRAPGAGVETAFAAVVEWTGPPLPGNPPAAVDVAAVDEVVVPDVELARRVAAAAYDYMHDGRELVDLRKLREAFEAGAEGAAGRYRHAVGEAGIAAAHEHAERRNR